MKKAKKILIILLMITISLMISFTKSKAVTTGSFSVAISNSSLKVGETTILSITVTNCEGQFSIVSSNSNAVTVSSTSEWISGTTNIIITAKNSGTATINVKAENVGDNQAEPEEVTGNKSLTVTVKENEISKPENPDNGEDNKPSENPGEENNNNQKPDDNENKNPENNENNNQNNTPQEPTFTETNKIMYVKSDCTSLNLREGPNKNYKSLGTLKTNEKITVIAIGSNGWYKARTEKGIEGYVAGNYLTDTEPEKNIESSIATLSNIKVTPGKLNETFSKNNLSYTMTVEADVDSINVTATPTDDKAKVTITGNTGLKTGTENEIIIKVVAEDGISTKTYKIKVTKLATEDEEPNIIEDPEEKKLGLSSLSIEGLKISPDFKSNVYEYKATLTDKTIEKLIVNAIATFEDSKVEITGADEIKNGENVITIIVTSANGEETVTYQIIVNKKEETVIAKTEPKEKEDSLQNIIIALIAAIAIVALILVFVLVKRKEKGKPVSFYEDGDYNEPEEDNTYSKLEKEDTQESIQEDEDDDWGTPKRGFRNKFKKTGRHF